MSKPFNYFPTYVPMYLYVAHTSYSMGYQGDINSVEVCPQWSHNGHPVAGALVDGGSL